MSALTRDAQVENCLAELIEGFEEREGFDVEGFLSSRPEWAKDVRERFERLVRSGLIAPASANVPPTSKVASQDEDAVPSPEFITSLRTGKRYQLLSRIGAGGMGEVMRAFDLDLERDVALKLARADRTRPGRASGAGRRWRNFLAEARITARLDHPNIVPVHDLGAADDGRLFYVMRLVQGITLQEFVERWCADPRSKDVRYSLRARLSVALSICDAIGYAHARGVVHRDLKPRNVMIGEFGEVVVMDWGLARERALRVVEESAHDESGPPSSFELYDTRDGDVIGTPSYMSPEQARGDTRRIDARTDVFGIGAILYQLVTGNPPYWGANLDEVQQRARTRDLNDAGMSESVAPVPREIRAVVARALAPSAGDRYPTVTALADDLRAFLELRPGGAWSETPVSWTVKLVRRRPAWILGGMLVLLAVVARSVVSENRVLASNNASLEWRADCAHFADEFQRRRDLVDTLEPDATARRAAVCAGAIETFRILGVDLARLEPAGGARALETLRWEAPDSAPEPARALLELGHWFRSCGIARAHWRRVGELRRADDGSFDRTIDEALAREHRELLDLWPRIESIVGALDLRPWERVDWELRNAWARDGVLPDVTRIASEVPAERAEVLRSRARVLFESGRHAASAAALREAIDLRPGSSRAQVELAWSLTHISASDAEEREEWLERAREASHGAFLPTLELGLALHQRRDLARAYELLSASTRLEPESPRAWYCLGATLRELGALDESEEAIGRALALDPGNPDALYQRAFNAYRRWRPSASREQTEVAVGACRAAIDARPGETRTWEMLVVLLNNRHERDEAVRVGRRGLERHPGDASITVALARTLVQALDLRPELPLETVERMLEEPVCMLRDVIAREPQGSSIATDARKDLATLEYNLALTRKDPREREAHWSSTASDLAVLSILDPHDPSLRMQLGRAWFVIGRREEGLAEIERSLDDRIEDLNGSRLGQLSDHERGALHLLSLSAVRQPESMPEFRPSLTRIHEKAQRVLDLVQQFSAGSAGRR